MAVSNLAAVNPYAIPADSDVSVQQPAPESTPKKWAGKYPTPEELENGHLHLQTTLTERNAELVNERQRREQLEQMLTNMAERMSPAERTVQRSRAEELLESTGIPIDALREIIDNRLSSTGPGMVEKVLAPITQGAQTQQTLGQEFPDISSSDVLQFLNANPNVKMQYDAKLSSGKTAEAMYYAYAQYSRSNAGPRDLSGKAEQQGQNRRDAALPTGRVGVQGVAEEGPSLADAWDMSEKSGNIMEFLRERLAHIPGIKPQQR